MVFEPNRVPVLVKHCALAIFKGKGRIKGGTRKERFISAWNIARSRLVEQGYLVKGSEIGPHGTIRLTAKGQQRNQEHKSEQGGSTKSREFDRLFEWVRDEEQRGGKME